MKMRGIKEVVTRCDTLETAIQNIEKKLQEELSSSKKKGAGQRRSRGDDEIPDASNLSTLTDEVAALRSELTNIRIEIDKLEEHNTQQDNAIDELEQYSRRNCLLVHGIKETPKENATEAAIGVLNSKLNLRLSVDDIDRCHRLQTRNTTRTAAQVVAEGHKPIIIKFISYRVRERVWKNKKMLKGTGILVTESLTVKRLKLYREVQEIVGKRRCWTMDGRIVLQTNSNRKVSIVTDRQLKDLITSGDIGGGVN